MDGLANGEGCAAFNSNLQMTREFRFKLHRPRGAGSRRERSSRGVSLMELVIASLLLGVVLAVVAELMVTAVIANNKLFNLHDAQVLSRSALDRMKRDIRMAASICPGKNCDAKVRVGDTFVPVHDELDPVFSSKQLSSSCLILHMPIYFLDKRNDPLSDSYENGALTSPFNGVPLPGYDTVIYEVERDPSISSAYFYRVNRIVVVKTGSDFRRNSDCSYRTASDPGHPTVFAKGLVGPTNSGDAPNAIPKVFSFLSRNPTVQPIERAPFEQVKESAFVSTSPSPMLNSLSQSISAIGIDFEFKKGDESTNSIQQFDKTIGVHAEVGLRVPPSQIGYSGAHYEPD